MEGSGYPLDDRCQETKLPGNGGLMSDFISRLIKRSYGLTETVRPLLPSRFEKWPHDEAYFQNQSPYTEHDYDESFVEPIQQSSPVSARETPMLKPLVRGVVSPDRAPDSKGITEMPAVENIYKKNTGQSIKTAVQNINIDEGPTKSEESTAWVSPTNQQAVTQPGNVSLSRQKPLNVVATGNRKVIEDGPVASGEDACRFKVDEAQGVTTPVHAGSLLSGNKAPDEMNRELVHAGEITMPRVDEKPGASAISSGMRDSRPFLSMQSKEKEHITVHPYSVSSEKDNERVKETPVINRAESMRNKALSAESHPTAQLQTIKVTIGRVEVKAIMQQAPPLKHTVTTMPRMTLDDYLKRKSKA
jgi:hypothetical protein